MQRVISGPAPLPWRGEHVSRLILGTAQLGMAYGVANSTGQPDQGRATAIVEAAWASGIRHFDTAQAYGMSETALGKALGTLGVADQARVATKLAADLDPRDAAALNASVTESLGRLGVGRLWGLLLHRPEWLAHWDAGLGGVLLGRRAAGDVAHLGASLYRPDQARDVLAHSALEVVQAAANAWDARLEARGYFDAPAPLVCVRSVFLQGLLLMTPEQAAARVPRAAQAARRWHELAKELDLPPKALAMRYALAYGVPLVVGAETPGQIAETAALAAEPPLDAAACARIRAAMAPCVSEQVLDPMRWPAR